jgi:hypothetical protein
VFVFLANARIQDVTLASWLAGVWLARQFPVRRPRVEARWIPAFARMTKIE